MNPQGRATIQALKSHLAVEGSQFGQHHALVQLEKTVRARLKLPRGHADLNAATPAERSDAFAYGQICGKAYVRRWTRYYGLNNKY